MRTYGALLKNRAFLFLYLGLLISRLGDGMADIVITWTVWESTSSPVMVAITLIINVVPRVVFSFAAGLAADRLVHRTIMAACDIGRMVVVAGAALLAWHGMLETWQLLVASFLISSLGALFGPARAACMPHLLPPDQVQPANGLMSGTFHGALLLGPFLGGMLLNVLNTGSLLMIDAATFVLSLAGILLLPVTRTQRAAHRQSVLADSREGLAMVRGTPALLWVIGTFAIGTFLAGGAGSVGKPLLVDRVGAGAAGLGSMSTVMGLGIMLGSLIAGRLSTRHRVRLVMLAWAADGLLLALLGVAPNLWALLAVSFASGIGTAFINVPTESLIQLHGGTNTGKVFSYWGISIWLGEAASLAVVGPLFSRLPYAAVFAIAGTAMAVAGLAAALRTWSLPDGAGAPAPAQAKAPA